MADKLVKISETEWAELRDFYEDRKTSPTGYGLIDNFIKWHAKHPADDIRFYALNGDWRSDGTYMIMHKCGELSRVYFNTRDDTLTRLGRLLRCLDPQAQYELCSFPKRLRGAVEAYLAARQLTHSTKIVDAFWYHAPKESLASFKPIPPAGISLAPMDVKYAALINENWPHRTPGSVRFIELLLSNNLNVGAFDATGNLVAWCLRYPEGALGILHVTEPYKRTGMGSLLAWFLSQQVAALDNGDEVLGAVGHQNVASLRMFEKLGVQIIDVISRVWVPAQRAISKM